MTASNIYDVLRESHEIQRAVFRKLLRSKPGSKGRADLFRQARHELAAHEAAEERYLYAPMLMHDTGLSASRHALHEHHQIDGLVEELQALDPAGDAWIGKARALSQEVHHHLREEERKFFQTSGKLLSDAQKLLLAGQYRRDYRRMHQLLAGRAGRGEASLAQTSA
ncbi:MAG TPA: hemerythrin domain-containing protein [Arenimonas sp.]|nr:hemerythrin domain-containing protein [Arenimonas sp.]